MVVFSLQLPAILQSSPSSDNMTINNSSGTFQALNGSIMVGSPNTTATNQTYSISGGNFVSQELNLDIPNGTADINVDQVTGVVDGTPLACI